MIVLTSGVEKVYFCDRLIEINVNYKLGVEATSIEAPAN